MNCYQCPLRSVCAQAQWIERQVDYMQTELEYATKRNEYKLKWAEIIFKQPEDVELEESLRSDNEAIELEDDEEHDELMYALTVGFGFREEKDKKILDSDEADCVGPKKIRKHRFFGEVTVKCMSASRIERAKMAEEALYDN